MCPPTLDIGGFFPWAPLDWLFFGASGGHCGVFPLGQVTPPSGCTALSCPRPGQPAVCSWLQLRDGGPRLPPPRGLWGCCRTTAPLVGAKPALPPIRGRCVGPQESTEVGLASPDSSPGGPEGSPALAPGRQATCPWGLPQAPSWALLEPALRAGRARLRPTALPHLRVKTHALVEGQVTVWGRPGRAWLRPQPRVHGPGKCSWQRAPRGAGSGGLSLWALPLFTVFIGHGSAK